MSLERKNSNIAVHKLFNILVFQDPDGDYVGEVNCSSGFREGWGEMRWANGSLYGPGNIFIYSQGDRYYGQWVEDRQEGM